MNASELARLVEAAKQPLPSNAAAKARVAVRVQQTVAIAPPVRWWKGAPMKVIALSAVAAGSLFTASRLQRHSAPIVAVNEIAQPTLTPIVLPTPQVTAPARVKAARLTAPTRVTAEMPTKVWSPPPSPTDRLEEERRLLDAANAALTHHDPEAALHSLATHAREFPEGVLVEEREAMSVRAYAADDEPEKARAAAHAFLLAYPDSVLKAAVLDALAKIH